MLRILHKKCGTRQLASVQKLYCVKVILTSHRIRPMANSLSAQQNEMWRISASPQLASVSAGACCFTKKWKTSLRSPLYLLPPNACGPCSHCAQSPFKTGRSRPNSVSCTGIQIFVDFTKICNASEVFFRFLCLNEKLLSDQKDRFFRHISKICVLSVPDSN